MEVFEVAQSITNRLMMYGPLPTLGEPGSWNHGYVNCGRSLRVNGLRLPHATQKSTQFKTYELCIWNFPFNIFEL